MQRRDVIFAAVLVLMAACICFLAYKYYFDEPSVVTARASLPRMCVALMAVRAAA